MIGKIARMGSNFLGVLEYCYFEKQENKSLDRSQIRGELIFSNGLAITEIFDPKVINSHNNMRLNLADIARQMEETVSYNKSIKKPVWHQSFSFPAGEKPSPDQLEKLIDDWQKTFGFTDNQLVVFLHTDTANTHYHFIGNRVNQQGINTSIDQHNYRETARLCRRLEKSLGLTPTKDIRQTNLDETLNTERSPELEHLRSTIDKTALTSKDLRTFTYRMTQFGYSVNIGRGITFQIDQTGLFIKGSALGREYSLASLTARLGTAIKTEPTSFGKETIALQMAIDRALEQSGSLAEFRLNLVRAGRYQSRIEPNPKTGQLVITFARQFAGGMVRIIPAYRLGKEYTLAGIKTRLQKQNKPALLSDADATKFLEQATADAESRHLQKTIDYQLRQSRTMTDFLLHMNYRSPWKTDYLTNDKGKGQFVYTLTNSFTRENPTITSHQLGQGYTYRELAERMREGPKTGATSTRLETSKPKNQVESSMPYASGGAQMDRDTKKDLAELEASMAAMRKYLTDTGKPDKLETVPVPIQSQQVPRRQRKGRKK